MRLDASGFRGEVAALTDLLTAAPESVTKLNNARALKPLRAAAGVRALTVKWLEEKGFQILTGEDGAYAPEPLCTPECRHFCQSLGQHPEDVLTLLKS